MNLEFILKFGLGIFVCLLISFIVDIAFKRQFGIRDDEDTKGDR